MPRLLAIIFGILAVVLVNGDQRVEYVVSGRCITKIAMKHDGECSGPDKDHMTCSGILATYKPECAEWRVAK